MDKTAEVFDKITRALADYLKRDAASIQANHHLRDDLGLDSMAVIEMLYKIEEVFNLQIPDEDLVDLTYVGQVVSYVERRLAPSTLSSPSSSAKRPAAKPSAKRTKA